MARGLLDALTGIGEAIQGAQQYQAREAALQRQQNLGLLEAYKLRQEQQQQQNLGSLWPVIQQLNQPPTGLQQAGGQDILTAAQPQQPQLQQQPQQAPPAQLPGVPSFGMGPGPSGPTAPSYAPAPAYTPAPSSTAARPAFYSSGLQAPAALKRRTLALEGDRDVVGAAGEIGPGQIMPSTGAQYGYSPDQLWGDSGRAASGRIVDDLYRRSGGDPAATLVGYNRGPGAMAKFQAAGDSLDAVPNLAPAYKNAIRGDIVKTGLQLRNQGVPNPVLQESSQGASGAAASIDPSQWGRAERKQIIDAIEKTMPNADPVVKTTAFMQLNKLLAPDEKMMAQLQMQQLREQYQFEMKQQSESFQQQMKLQSEEFQAAQKQTMTPYQQERLDIERQKAAGGGGEKLEASKLFDILDEKNKVVGQVEARERRDRAGFIYSEGEKQGQEITLPPGQHLRQITPSQTGGGRAQQFLQRQLTAGEEVLTDLQNAVALPLGTTTGPFGTYAQGQTLFGALQGDLVRTITDQNSRFMQISMASLERELSALEMPVYGGAFASKQLEPLIPRAGDSVATTLMALGKIAQISDAALNSIIPSPNLSNEQKEHAENLRANIRQAIPWTPLQAMAYGSQGQRGQSFSDFVKSGALGGGIPKVDDQGNEIKSDKRSEISTKTQLAGDYPSIGGRSVNQFDESFPIPGEEANENRSLENILEQMRQLLYQKPKLVPPGGGPTLG